MQNYKLGVGPMSLEIIDIINSYDGKMPLMVVASRNQVDHDSGYVCRTADLANSITDPSILVCRDHCGPYFSDKDKSLTLSEALEECKLTINRDIRSGFDLIHIDVSRIEHHQLDYAKELIEYTLDCDPTMMLEFGSEDNTGEGLGPSMARIEDQLAFIEQYKDNVRYFVTQTGSFTQHMQMGTFDIPFNTAICDRIHNAGFMFKEHNADYLSDDDIAKRRVVGIDALNIAPQLGAVQTRILKEVAGDSKEWYEFAKRVLASNMWVKWLPRDVTNKELAVVVAGHYHFNTIEYTRLMGSIDVGRFKYMLNKEINSIFDSYTRE
jgi:hypothetical protein